MLDWVAANAALLQVAVAIVSALVWLVYLQLFLVSFLRQKRTEILINRGAGVGRDARCFIANLGLEPVYVSQILMTVECDDGRFDASITDREKLTDAEICDPGQATNQGPLKSGDSFDAGSFGDLLAQALRAHGQDEDAGVTAFELTVVALHAGNAMCVGATRRFDLIRRGGDHDIVPDGLATRQLRSVLARRRLRAKLRRDLSWYRS